MGFIRIERRPLEIEYTNSSDIGYQSIFLPTERGARVSGDIAVACTVDNDFALTTTGPDLLSNTTLSIAAPITRSRRREADSSPGLIEQIEGDLFEDFCRSGYYVPGLFWRADSALRPRAAEPTSRAPAIAGSPARGPGIRFLPPRQRGACLGMADEMGMTSAAVLPPGSRISRPARHSLLPLRTESGADPRRTLQPPRYLPGRHRRIAGGNCTV